MRKKILAVAILAALPLTAQQTTQENLDLGVLNQIKWQAFNNSQVMDHLFDLSEVMARVSQTRPIIERRRSGL